VDWEAILNQDPAVFMERLSAWLVPQPILDAWAAQQQQQAAAAAAAGTGGEQGSPADAAAPSGAPAAAADANGTNAKPSSTTPQPAPAANGATSSPKGSPVKRTKDGLTGAALTAAARPLPSVSSLPAVAEVLGTMRARLEALNGPDLPRI
jgi:hypothetical protein